MPIDLTSRLTKSDTDSGELECFLTTTLGSASQSEPRRTVYGDQLAIEYTKRNRIRKIEWLDDTTAAKAEALAQEAEAALYDDVGTEIDKFIFFADKPVEGVLRIQDDFQIVPLPNEAPKITGQLVGAHPGMLEFSFRKSPNKPVEWLRRDARKEELLLVLVGILGSKISAHSKYTAYEWVYVGKGDKATSEYCQIGYNHEDGWKNKDGAGFSVEDSWQNLGAIPSQTYYDTGGGKRPFELPDTFAQTYEIFDFLGDDDRRRFLRSAHWYKTSREVFYSSRSLAYAVLVIALEALLPPAQLRRKWWSFWIYSKRDSIGQTFRIFLDRYCAGLSRQKINEFMTLRSKYVHGLSLMLSDAEATGFRFSAPLNDERRNLREMEKVCHIAMLNWLSSQNSP